MSSGLRHYASVLARDFRGTWRTATIEELERSARRAKVILSADFHAYTQSQRAHLRLLRDHIGVRPVVLVVECLAPEHNAVAQDYLNGKLSEADFLLIVNWEKTWGFPWENYRPLFELARDRGMVLRGIFHSGKGGLSRRDSWTSAQILRLHEEFPQHLLFVLLGEFHLAEAHVPRLLRHRMAKDAVMVIHQDVEPIYFKLAASRREATTDLLRTRGSTFCLMVSPPWMKWQSYLMYLEQAYDRDLQEGLSIDYTDHVAALVELLENDLKINTTKSRLEVYCSNSKVSVTRHRLTLKPKQQKVLLYHLENGLSFFMPERTWCYLSRPTINHASSLAGQFVHSHLSGRKKNLWDLPNDFLPLIWTEAVGFFFSKWINPQRKAESLENIRLQLASQSSRNKGRTALLLTLDHRLTEVLWVKTGRLRRSKFKPREASAYVDAARILGGMLGERLFQKVRSRTISLPKLMSYLSRSVDVTKAGDANETMDFAKFYWKLVEEIDDNLSL